MIALRELKTLSLALLIGFAVLLKCGEACAGQTETLVVAGGCFWCVEADFEKVRGVTEAVSGFAGGKVPNPTYKQVVRGGTGHYEVVQIQFDPAQVSRETLLSMFFRSIDPTDPGGQFCDRGDAYRTAIFASNPQEERLAEQVRAEAQTALGQEIVTPVLPLDALYPAEEYHQDYYKKDDLIPSRFGPISKEKAYKRYRAACSRDQRVRELWGDAAPFAGS